MSVKLSRSFVVGDRVYIKNGKGEEVGMVDGAVAKVTKRNASGSVQLDGHKWVKAHRIRLILHRPFEVGDVVVGKNTGREFEVIGRTGEGIEVVPMVVDSKIVAPRTVRLA